MEIGSLALEIAVLGTTRFTAVKSDQDAQRVGPVEFSVTSEPLGTGCLYRVSVTNTSRSPVPIRRAGLGLLDQPKFVLESGYQSWSPVRRCSPQDVRPSRRIHPLMATGCYHANHLGAGRTLASDQVALWENEVGQGGVCCFLDTQVHLSTIEVSSPDSPTDPSVWAWALLDRLVVDPGQRIQLDPLWIAQGDSGTIYSEAATHWGAVSHARVSKPSPASPRAPGWCSWYQYWWKIAPDQIRHNLAIARDHSFGLFVLDDGYQAQVGDWLAPNERWSKSGSQIGDIAQDIAEASMMAGIWTAPFLAGKKSQIAREHPEWLVRATRGAYPRAMVYNPVSWGGMVYGLDTTQNAVVDFLIETFSRLKELGYSYHKIDFCYAATMPGRRHQDGKMTRAQGLRRGLDAVRQGIGDDGFLLGCGCPFGPAVGVVDAMRVSPDVSPWWNPTALKWPAYPDSAPAALNSVRASVLRSPFHRRLFINDPDCVLLRPTKTRLSEVHRRTLHDMAAGTGGFMVYSDDLGLYGRGEWDQIESVAKLAHNTDTPLDLRDPFSKTLRVDSSGSTLEIAWKESKGSPLSGLGWRLQSGGPQSHLQNQPGESRDANLPWSNLTGRRD